MNRHAFLATPALLLLCLTTMSCERRLEIDTQTRLSEVEALMTAEDHARLKVRLDEYYDRTNAAYHAGERVEHARATLALLLLSRSIPTFLLDEHLPDFMIRVEKEGIEPFLSYYIDIGRRLSCASTPSATGLYSWMTDVFASTAATHLGSQIAFLRKDCRRDSAVEGFSDNVGWAVAALVFSDFGKNLGTFSPQILEDLLEVAQYGTTCSNCQTEEDGGPSTIRADAASAGGSADGVRDLVGDEGPDDSCSILNAVLSLSMGEETQNVFCDATNDIKDSGFSGTLQACFERLREMTVDATIPEAETTIESLERFSDFIACRNQELNPRTTDTLYNDISTYFQGAPGGAGRCEPLAGLGHGVCSHSDRYGKQANYYDENGNPLKTEYTYPRQTNPATGATKESEGWHHPPSGNTVSRQTIQTQEGDEYTSEQSFNASNNTSQTSYSHKDPTTGKTTTQTKTTKDGQTTYTKTVDGEESESTKKEFEAAKKKHEEVEEEHFPTSPSTRPSPDEPSSPCDVILTGSTTMPVAKQDLGELIQFDPYESIDSAFESLRSCLENFDDHRRCETRMMCIDERDELECECEAFTGGALDPPDHCDYIQCGEEATIVNCMCVDSGGGVLPGLGGPLFTGSPVVR